MNHLEVRSCLIDGEVDVLRRNGSDVVPACLRALRRNEPQAFLDAFDLLELNGT